MLGEGVPAAYIDLAQIGFCRPATADDPDHHRLKAHYLGRGWKGSARPAPGVDTDGREVGELADFVRAEAGGWPSLRTGWAAADPLLYSLRAAKDNHQSWHTVKPRSTAGRSERET